MQSKQNLITNKSDILELASLEIEMLILDELALKAEVIKKENKMKIKKGMKPSVFKVLEI